MARRRMFSPDIVCSDAFFDMPASSRELYFQLGMKADDDGFVNPRGTMRLTGASQDDLSLLVAKSFILPFQNGVIVIKHWRMSNRVRTDWYTPTQYIDEKSQLYIKENGAYTKNPNKGLPLGTDSVPTRSRSIGKDSIGTSAQEPRRVPEDEEEQKPKSKPKYPHSKEVFGWFPKPERSWSLNTTELSHAELLFERGEAEVKKRLKYIVNHSDEDFLPKITKPSELERKWNDLSIYAKRNR